MLQVRTKPTWVSRLRPPHPRGGWEKRRFQHCGAARAELHHSPNTYNTVALRCSLSSGALARRRLALVRSLHALGRCDAQKAEVMREYPSDLMAEQETRTALLFGIRSQHRAIPVENRKRACEPVKIAAQPLRFE